MTGPVKRSLTIAGHPTSISLEPVFWDGLQRASDAAGLPLNALVARIDATRIAAADAPNLASAVRVWLYVQAIDIGPGTSAAAGPSPDVEFAGD